MVSGPYRSGTQDPKVHQLRLQSMNDASLLVFEKGHTPVVGVNIALPLIERSSKYGYQDLMMPICLKIAEKCDAVLRIGGPSTGADDEVNIFKSKGLPVYYSIEEIPTKI